MTHLKKDLMEIAAVFQSRLVSNLKTLRKALMMPMSIALVHRLIL